jgi:hypothetical protein
MNEMGGAQVDLNATQIDDESQESVPARRIWSTPTLRKLSLSQTLGGNNTDNGEFLAYRPPAS